MDDPSASSIHRATVVSTGAVRIRPDHARATWKPTFLWLLTSQRWTGPKPINVYVIEHERGVVVFDTGQDRASVTDPDYFPTGLAGVVFDRLARFEIAEDETLPVLMQAEGFDPAAVTHVVISHLHQDHIGGIADFPEAEVIVSRDEWDAHRKAGAEVQGYMRDHIDLPGVSWRIVDFEPTADPLLADFGGALDLFGDGSLVVLPTAGHTSGSISLLVRRPGWAPILLAGDLTFDAHHFDEEHIPGIGSRRQLRASTKRVRALRARLPGLVVAAAHDPGAAELFTAAISDPGGLEKGRP
nr:N-acyl homoserine lactonase family protein [Microbacterium thalassium]